MNAPTIWDDVLARIASRVNRFSFATWFTPTFLIADEGDRIIIGVPSPLLGLWLEARYAALLRQVLAEVGRSSTVVFVTDVD